ncbi:MAG: hypothetical protein D6679_07295 [Candidatus Hydrogenedentota bacterium]|nr:MAG: hypothetical protein D6679_07295 [Candidatus Hydrogenedentota bacterium]
MLWGLRSVVRWKDPPDKNPSPSTCWLRHEYCQEEGVWLKF